MYRFAYAMNFVLSASAGVIFVFLADIQERFGLTGLQVGLIASMGFASSFVASMVLSPIADRGHLMPVGAASIAVAVLGNIGFVFAPGFWTLFASRALVGLGIGLFAAGSRKALIGIETSGSGAKMGAMLSAGVAGFVAGPALGAVLESVSFEAPFYALTAAIVVLAGPVLMWIRAAPVATARVDVRDMLPLLGRPAIQAALLAQVLLFANIGLFDSVTDRYLTDLGASTTQVALLLATLGLPMALLAAPAGAFVDSHNTKRVFIISCALMAPVLALYGVVPSLIVFAVVGVADGLLSAFAFPSTQVIVIEETGAAQSAIGQGLLEGTGQLAGAFAALIAPALYASRGPRAAYGAFGLVGLLCVLGARSRLGSLAPDSPTNGSDTGCSVSTGSAPAV